MRVWLFQTNPRNYDFETNPPHNYSWTVVQRKQDLEAALGETVYLWQTGSDGGILGRGTVSGAPRIRRDDEKGNWKEIPPSEYVIDLTVEWLSNGQRISRDSIETSTGLRLPAYQGTNLLLSDDVAQALDQSWSKHK